MSSRKAVGNPEFVLRDRRTGRIFGVNPHHESDPNFEKVAFAKVFPEKCMPEHIKDRVEEKPTKKKTTKKKKLDLETKEIPDDPDEILETSLNNEIDEALSEDATRGL